jgi:hypothetical protein
MIGLERGIQSYSELWSGETAEVDLICPLPIHVWFMNAVIVQVPPDERKSAENEP